jgi:hypothetical protein
MEVLLAEEVLFVIEWTGLDYVFDVVLPREARVSFAAATSCVPRSVTSARAEFDVEVEITTTHKASDSRLTDFVGSEDEWETVF